MGHFKRLFSAILCLVMLATMVVPSQAANIAYSEEAIMLQNIKVFAGKPSDLNLDQDVTRIQGLTFAIRAAGNDATVLAMSESEIDNILASWDDAPTYADWARRYIAFAIKTKMTVGTSSDPKKKIFGPDNPISGAAFLVFLLKGMGYETATIDNSAELAITSDVLSISQAASFAVKPSLIRDNAAGVLYSAFKTGINKDGTKLINYYIAKGATTEEDAAANGFIKLAPKKLEAIGTSATNLKEIVISFNTELDPVSAVDKDNYSVVDYTIDNIRLNEDKKSVNIMLVGSMKNQEDYKVTVNTDVKSATGINLEAKKELKGNAFDRTIPVALSAEQTGPTSFKVRFSEPVQTKNATIKLDEGSYTFFVSSIVSADNGYSLDVNLYSTIYDGTHKVEITNVEDYVPYRCVVTNLTFVAKKDEVPPAFSRVISATPEKVELEFTKDVNFVDGELEAIKKIYHTNTANKPTSVSVSGNKLTLYFTYNKLPNGTAYITIGESVFKDAWGNRNAAIKDMPITVKADRTKPTVKSVQADGDKSIIIDFSEDIQSGVGKFSILNSDGKDVTSDYSIGTVFEKARVKLTFSTALSGKSYSVVIEDVKDSAGNVIDRIAPNVVVTDKTPPVISKGEIYKTKKIIKITFDEAMSTTDILNAGNYQWGGMYLSETEARISLAEGNKAIYIDYSKETRISDTNHVVTVGRVRDVSGNAMANFSNTVVLNDMDLLGVTITSVEATGAKTLVVTLSDSLVNFVPSDFLINNETLSKYITNVIRESDKDGKTIITFALRDEYKIKKTDLSETTMIVSTLSNPAEIKSSNSFGVKLAALNSMVAVDKIAPTFEAKFEDNSNIILSFSEKVDRTTLSKFTFVVSGNTVTGVDIPSDGLTMKLTLKDAVNYNAKVTISQAHAFEDDDGNISKGLSVEVTNK